MAVGVRHRGYRHGRTNRVRFELTNSERYRAEGSMQPSAYEQLIKICEELGIKPAREDGGTIVFRLSLAQSRELIGRAEEIGLHPVMERGKTISFRTTVEEHQLLVDAGARVGLSATGFAAVAALETATLELGHRLHRRRVKDYEALRQMVVEMQLATNQVSKAGVLLNQAVKKLQIEGRSSPELRAAAQKVTDTVDNQDRLVFELGDLLRGVLH